MFSNSVTEVRGQSCQNVNKCS